MSPEKSRHIPDNVQSYNNFALIYDQIALSRNHYERQANAVCDTFEVLGVSKSARILDASCGTGAVVNLLQGSGFEQVKGSDGSSCLLALSGGERSIQQVLWRDLGDAGRGDVDAIFFAGHSLPHAEASELPQIFAAAYDRLAPGGWIIFDMRNWVETEAGLREPNRATGIFEPLPEILVNEKRLWLAHRCDYDKDRQKITYRYGGGDYSQSLDNGFDEILLEYSVFSRHSACSWLKAAGFDEPKELSIPNWSYLFIAAQKPTDRER